MTTGLPDLELVAVEASLRKQDPDGSRFARTLRRTYDQIYDGRNTGRFRWDQLGKTEKTHFGSLVEINLQREFAFEDGQQLTLDYRIAGIDVDCKWSQTDGGWMLPPEVVGRICLVITGRDEDSNWSAGLVRADSPYLNTGENRDAKKTFNAAGRAAIQWIWRNAPLPENTLLHIDPSIVTAVMNDLASSGQKRLNELFRRVPNRPIGRGVVATVAQQDDYMKRVRGNGGSRQYLKPEGIVVFGDYRSHRKLAADLGLPVIGDGDSMSARLKRVDGPTAASIFLEDSWYQLCAEGEEPTKPAPDLPRVRRTGT